MRIGTLAGVLLLTSTLAPGALGGSIKLKAVRFPSSITGTGGTTTPPTAAPLSQRVVFEFTGEPKIGSGVAQGLKIRVSDSNNGCQPVGQVAYGTYEVDGDKVIFTPRLPTVDVNSTFGTTSDVAGNAGLPGLLPDTEYKIDVTIGNPNSVANLVALKKSAGVPLTFRTTSVLADYFSNASSKAAKVKKKKISPSSGTKGIHPSVYSDPAGLFSKIKSKKRPPFSIVFDKPISTKPVNFTRNFIRLRAVETPEGLPVDEVLGSTSVLVSNEPNKAKVLLYPTGNLPLGHKVLLEVSNKLLSLSNAQQAGPSEPEEFEKLATYRVATDPVPGAAVDTFIEET
ncbi:MAG: hypothetical protein ACF8XB_13500, partial [Planctomycetota bacterium JB042]